MYRLGQVSLTCLGQVSLTVPSSFNLKFHPTWTDLETVIYHHFVAKQMLIQYKSQKITYLELFSVNTNSCINSKIYISASETHLILYCTSNSTDQNGCSLQFVIQPKAKQ